MNAICLGSRLGKLEMGLGQVWRGMGGVGVGEMRGGMGKNGPWVPGSGEGDGGHPLFSILIEIHDIPFGLPIVANR
jgi:hypothetical protein